MSGEKFPIAILAGEAPLGRVTSANYPEPFATRLRGKEKQKRPLGMVFGLTNFGVNLSRLAPGGISALRHAHSRQDEFIYVLEGRLLLRTDAGDVHLSANMCAGFKAGSGNGHMLLNTTDQDAIYIEIGDRASGDTVQYPDDDIQAVLIDGKWKFAHKNGAPY